MVFLDRAKIDQSCKMLFIVPDQVMNIKKKLNRANIGGRKKMPWTRLKSPWHFDYIMCDEEELQVFNSLCQFRHEIQNIFNDPHISYLKNRGFRIFIDSNNKGIAFYAAHMLE